MAEVPAWLRQNHKKGAAAPAPRRFADGGAVRFDSSDPMYADNSGGVHAMPKEDTQAAARAALADAYSDKGQSERNAEGAARREVREIPDPSEGNPVTKPAASKRDEEDRKFTPSPAAPRRAAARPVVRAAPPKRYAGPDQSPAESARLARAARHNDVPTREWLRSGPDAKPAAKTASKGMLRASGVGSKWFDPLGEDD